MGWVSWPLFIFMILTSISALWWPNIWPKMGFLQTKKSQTIGSIHFIPGICPYGVSLLTPIHFCARRINFIPPGYQIFGQNGVSKFKKQNRQFIWYMAFTLKQWVSWPLFIFGFLTRIAALCMMPNICPKREFPELWPLHCVLSLWGKIINPMYRLWLHGLYGLHGPGFCCPRKAVKLNHSLNHLWVWNLKMNYQSVTTIHSLFFRHLKITRHYWKVLWLLFCHWNTGFN